MERWNRCHTYMYTPLIKGSAPIGTCGFPVTYLPAEHCVLFYNILQGWKKMHGFFHIGLKKKSQRFSRFKVCYVCTPCIWNVKEERFFVLLALCFLYVSIWSNVLKRYPFQEPIEDLFSFPWKVPKIFLKYLTISNISFLSLTKTCPPCTSRPTEKY